jgi:hypothetical protein
MSLEQARRKMAITCFGPSAGERWDNGVCVRCGAELSGFRDGASQREASQSRLCQSCQDMVFGEDDE